MTQSQRIGSPPELFTSGSHALDWGLIRSSKALDYQEIEIWKGIDLFIDKKLENGGAALNSESIQPISITQK